MLNDHPPWNSFLLPTINTPGSQCHTHELQSESYCPGVFHPGIWVSFTRCNIKSWDIWLRTDLSPGIRAQGIYKQILQSKYCLESYVSTKLLSMLGEQDNSEQKSLPLDVNYTLKVGESKLTGATLKSSKSFVFPWLFYTFQGWGVVSWAVCFQEGPDFTGGENWLWEGQFPIIYSRAVIPPDTGQSVRAAPVAAAAGPRSGRGSPAAVGGSLRSRELLLLCSPNQTSQRLQAKSCGGQTPCAQGGCTQGLLSSGRLGGCLCRSLRRSWVRWRRLQGCCASARGVQGSAHPSVPAAGLATAPMALPPVLVTSGCSWSWTRVGSVGEGTGPHEELIDTARGITGIFKKADLRNRAYFGYFLIRKNWPYFVLHSDLSLQETAFSQGITLSGSWLYIRRRREDVISLLLKKISYVTDPCLKVSRQK